MTGVTAKLPKDETKRFLRVLPDGASRYSNLEEDLSFVRCFPSRLLPIVSTTSSHSACYRSVSLFLLASTIAPASMNPTKDELVLAQSGVHELPDVTPGDSSEKLGNEWDQRGMVRLGKKQELRREFHFFSITGYAMILGCSWEFALM